MSLENMERAFLRDYIKRESGIVLGEDKDYLLDARLTPLLADNDLPSLGALVVKLRAGSRDLARATVEALTTNETSFFRNHHVFDYLQATVLPDRIREHKSRKSMRIWCGATSTGQETYSVAILMREHFSELRNWDLEYLSTDLDEQVLKRAREGIYSLNELGRGMSEALRDRYFREVEAGRWQVDSSLRSMIRFQQLNLLDGWPPGGFSILFLRNVLIYFDAPTKEKLLRQAARAIEPGGYLILGSTEGLGGTIPGLQADPSMHGTFRCV